MREIVLIAHNLRSCHNVGSLLRTAEGLGLQKVYLTGYTPYPLKPGDSRLPHIAAKSHQQIQKTALGAEQQVDWEHAESIELVVGQLRATGMAVVALEQTSNAQDLPTWNCPVKIAIIVGRETKGLEEAVLKLCDYAVQIPMLGKKESFNVVQAAAMALYHCRFSDLRGSGGVQPD